MNNNKEYTILLKFNIQRKFSAKDAIIESNAWLSAFKCFLSSKNSFYSLNSFAIKWTLKEEITQKDPES